MTKGERRELELLEQAPQPAYVGHQNRARSGVQHRLVIVHKWARFLPLGKLEDMLRGDFPEHMTVEITDAGRAALAEARQPR